MSTTNSIVYEHPEIVCFDLDDDSRRSKVDQFLDWVYNQYGCDMYDFFKKNYDGILENKIPAAYAGYNTGTRLSKVLMKEFGASAEDVRQKLSMLIQSNKVAGKLCLSVHPLDFLSASENNHSWRSCHALDGEYRVGNISYMMDNCTFIAYLKSDSPDVKLPNFPEDVPWNDKKWRCYFYIDRENKIIYAAKQYPFFSETALKYIADILREKFGYFWTVEYKKELLDSVNQGRWIPWGSGKKYAWNDFMSEFVHQRSFEPVGLKGDVVINGHSWYFEDTKVIVGHDRSRRIVPVTKYITTHPDACCFNDVIQSHSYAPWTLVYDLNDGTMPVSVENRLVVGKGVPCVYCNQNLTADSDVFLCSNCRDDEKQCDRCGCVDETDYMHYDEERGQWLCDSCYSELYDR